MKPNLNYDLKIRDFPAQVIIETCSICNLSCSICPYPTLKRDKGIMREHLFRKIIDEISDIDKDVKIWPAQLGEPLLLGDYLFELIKYANAKNLSVFLNTNGMLIEKYLKQILSSGLKEVIIGLDGVSEENYQKVRVGGDFTHVTNNIKMLLWKKQDSLKVTVQFVETEANDHEKEAFIDYWLDHGAVVKVRNQLGWGPTLPSQKKKLQIERVPCPWLMRTVVVHWNGNVVQCGGDCEESYPVGNVATSSIYDLWNGPLKMRRERHLNNDFSSEPCRDCSDWACGIAERYYPDPHRKIYPDQQAART